LNREKEFEKRLAVLKEAATDLRYLLNRGYNKPSALKLVGDRYQLNKIERSILFRSVYSQRECMIIKSKRVEPGELRENEIWIDGFNVLNTVEAILRGECVILCDDGVIRDFSEIHSKYKITELTEAALSAVADFLKMAEVRQTVILFETQISKSGELAALTRSLMTKSGIKCTAKTTKTVDSELIKSGKIIASSDSALLLKCRKFIDLPAHLNIINKAKILTLDNTPDKKITN